MPTNGSACLQNQIPPLVNADAIYLLFPPLGQLNDNCALVRCHVNAVSASKPQFNLWALTGLADRYTGLTGRLRRGRVRQESTAGFHLDHVVALISPLPPPGRDGVGGLLGAAMISI